MFSYVPQTIPRTIFVVGAGGTGSRLMPLLAQFIRTITRGESPTGWVEAPVIFLIDDDEIEQKNLLRQNFIISDVGKSKAAVLAERYSRAYGTQIIPIIQRVENGGDKANILRETITSHLKELNNFSIGNEQSFGSLINNSIVISCVDSVDARRHILSAFVWMAGGLTNNTVFIDAGNEDDFGQVKIQTMCQYKYSESDGRQQLSHFPDSKLPQMIPKKIALNHLPLDAEAYAGAVQTPGQGSCADLDQTLAINAIMATTIIGMVQNYYYRKPFDYNLVSISLNGGSYTQFNTFADYKNRARKITGGGNWMTRNDSFKDVTGENYFLSKMPIQSLNQDLGVLTNSILLEQQKAREAEAKVQAEKAKQERAERLREQRDRERAEEARIALELDAARAAVLGTEEVKPDAMIEVSTEPVRAPRRRARPAGSVAVRAEERSIQELPPLVQVARAPAATVTLVPPQSVPEAYVYNESASPQVARVTESDDDSDEQDSLDSW